MSGMAAAQTPYFPTSTQWDTIPAQQLQWTSTAIQNLHTFLDTSGTKAFILLEDGKIAAEWYFDGFTEDSLWYWASAGKSLMAFLVGMAQERGALNIDSSTQFYLGAGWTSMPASQEQAITLRHQLTMTTGLDDSGANLDCTDPSCLSYLAAPGTRWSYHNAPYTLLHRVLQQATGSSTNAFILQELMPTTRISGVYLPIGDLEVFFSNARSMARFGLLIVNRGMWNGVPLLADTHYFNAMVSPSQSLNEAYGYLWWLNGQSSYMAPGVPWVIPGPIFSEAPPDALGALGKDDQRIYVVPSKNWVVIRLGESAGGFSPALSGFDQSLWTRLNALDGSVSVDDFSAHPTVTIFPNPANKQVEIQLSEACRVRVFDARGRQLFQSRSPQLSLRLDVSTWTPGEYWIEARQASGRARRAFQVMH